MKKQSHGARKPRRIRWPKAVNTFAMATYLAAKPPQHDIDDMLHTLRCSHTAMREGRATEMDWSVLGGSVDVGLAIERQGVVRGLSDPLATAEIALQSIYRRAMVPGDWQSPTLHHHEIEALNEFVTLHAFQVNQLGRREFLRAIEAAAGQIRSTGATVTMVKDFESLAA
jgi:hypothetical protein